MPASSRPSSASTLAQHVVAIQHELGTALDDGPRVTRDQLLRPHPAADPVAGLQHHDLAAGLGEPPAAISPAKPAPTTTTRTLASGFDRSPERYPGWRAILGFLPSDT